MADFEGPWGRPEPDDVAKPPAKSPVRPSRVRSTGTLVIYLGVALLCGVGIWALMRAFPGRISVVDDWGGVTYRVGLLALVTASLFTYRLALGQVLRYAVYWVAVAGVLVLGYSYRGELVDAARRVRAELIPGCAIASGAHEMILAQDGDGAFSVMGRVDGRPVRFVIDTGASDIVLTPDAARSLGVDPARLQFQRGYETANGVGEGAAFTAESLDVGGFHAAHVPMTINRAPMRASLLGMAFLRRLQGFEMRGGHMILRWR